MILTKEMAEKAKALIGYEDRWTYNGVCRCLNIVSDERIRLREWDLKFWKDADFPDRIYKWRRHPEGDEKRRIFIDSLIGKDL